MTYLLQELLMKLQLTELRLTEQSTLRSELAKKEMDIEKLKKENEVLSQPKHPGYKKVATKNYVHT